MFGAGFGKPNRARIAYVPEGSGVVVQDRSRSGITNEKALKPANGIGPEHSKEISGAILAVQRTSNLLKKMSARPQDLEDRLSASALESEDLRAVRDASAADRKVVVEMLASEAEQRLVAGTLNKEHEARSGALADDSFLAEGDMTRLTSVIENAFGSIERTLQSLHDSPDKHE